MSPRRPTTRRDSFGLEIREDGTVGFNFLSPDVGTTATDSNSRRGAERRENKDHSPPGSSSDSWRSIVSLTKTRRRRDSFGLEVREDGSLSFDQLTTANVDLKTSGNTKRKPSLSGLGDNGLRRTRTQPGRNRRRRDSFGLEIRENGTLSFERPSETCPATAQSSGDNSTTHNDRRREVHRNRTGGQVSDSEVVQRYRIQPTQNHPRTPNHTSNLNSTNVHAASSPREHQHRTNNRAVQGGARNVEVEILRERVRVLEATLAGHDTHVNNAAEQLPAYQSRPCSPLVGRRQSQSVTGHEEN